MTISLDDTRVVRVRPLGNVSDINSRDSTNSRNPIHRRMQSAMHNLGRQGGRIATRVSIALGTPLVAEIEAAQLNMR